MSTSRARKHLQAALRELEPKARREKRLSLRRELTKAQQQSAEALEDLAHAKKALERAEQAPTHANSKLLWVLVRLNQTGQLATDLRERLKSHGFDLDQYSASPTHPESGARI